jgi:vancomycin resistance protein YoaR
MRRVILSMLVCALWTGSASAAPSTSTTLVGAFTTPFQCCQPRVTNIRRAAQVLDRRVIPAHGRFSLNAALGERTIAKGYVPAPSISGERYVDSIGGGISQVSTTLYNAAFFAGLRLVAHTPHSFYISRYPAGREATVSWGGPELVFVNDWDAPIRVRTFVGAESLTVRFYSDSLERRVTSWTGKPYAYVQPTTLIVHNPGLPLGARRVVQEAGGAGFSIQYGRRVYQGSELVSSERWRVTYQPENRIIEVGTR